MNLKKTLSALVSAITEEADRNDAFKASLERALNIDHTAGDVRQVPGIGETPRRGGRRTPAVLDPVELARQGEDVLRARLSTLNLEQLRDVVAQYGMDPGKLVMKWKDSNRVMGRIVELALARATKGDAFREN
jgi:hypothetical protein